MHLSLDISDYDRTARTVDFHNSVLDIDGIFERECVDDVAIGRCDGRRQEEGLGSCHESGSRSELGETHVDCDNGSNALSLMVCA